MDKLMSVKKLLASITLCCISACGGGGGGSDASVTSPVPTPPVVTVPPTVPVPETPIAPVTPVPPAQPDPVAPTTPGVTYPALKFTPSKVVEVMLLGESRVSKVQITLSSPTTEALFFRFFDPTGVLQLSSTVTQENNVTYTALVKMPSTLSFGTYEGYMEIQVCRDAACSNPISYSRQLLPYSVSALHTIPVEFVNPISISQSFYVGQDATVSGMLAAPPEHSKINLYVTATDPKGVFINTSDFRWNGDSMYEFTLKTVPALASGRYRGNVEIRACRDKECSARYPVATMSVPYDVEVRALSTLTALTRWSGVSDWQRERGNAQRSSYVPVTLDVSTFSRRWAWPIPGASYMQRTPVTISANHVFLNAGAILYALKESDGSVAWSRDFGRYPSSTASGDMLYVSTGTDDQRQVLYGVNATTGTTVFTSYSSLPKRDGYTIPPLWMEPILSGGKLFHSVANGGTNGVQALEALTGTPLWFAPMTSATVQGSNLFSLDQGLSLADAATGTFQGTIATPELMWTSSSASSLAPVAGASGSIFGITRPDDGSKTRKLVNFNVAQNKVAWSSTGTYGDNFAYAEGVVYAVDEATSMLEARAENDGKLLWSWEVPRRFMSFAGTDILVTKNLVFVSFSGFTYALDVKTHQLVWTEPTGGMLSMSANGVLYISALGGSVVGFNVK